jgi:hypothetical protein
LNHAPSVRGFARLRRLRPTRKALRMGTNGFQRRFSALGIWVLQVPHPQIPVLHSLRCALDPRHNSLGRVRTLVVQRAHAYVGSRVWRVSKHIQIESPTDIWRSARRLVERWNEQYISTFQNCLIVTLSDNATRRSKPGGLLTPQKEVLRKVHQIACVPTRNRKCYMV